MFTIAQLRCHFQAGKEETIDPSSHFDIPNIRCCGLWIKEACRVRTESLEAISNSFRNITAVLH